MDDGVVMSDGKKSTEAQVALRVSEIVDILIKGGNRQDILQYAATSWGIKERQTDTYISRAWELIEETTEKNRDRSINLAIKRYEDLYRRSHKVQDYRECRQIINDQVKLLGLAEPDKIEHTSLVNIKPLEWVKTDGDQ